MRHARTVDPIVTALSAALIAGIGVSGRIFAQGAPTDSLGLPVPGRSVVATRLGIVASSSPLASAAGVRMLDQGGNAIDAAIAANATLGVVEPMMNGIGGDLFAIVYEAKTGKLYGLNSGGWAASGLSAEVLAAKGITRMPQRGVYSVTVPGAVAGWDALRSRFGTMGFDKLLAPAISYASDGFPLGEVVAEMWAEAPKNAAANAQFRETYLVNGRAPAAGDIFRNADLATSLTRIAQRGAAGFYTGPTADAIVAMLRDLGGTMTPQDLAEFTAEWVTPLHTTYHGWTVYELPPNGQGIAALEMLNIMGHFPLTSYGFHSARSLHVMIEAKKLAYSDLLRYVGDPRFSKIPVEHILSAENAGARAAAISPERAQCRVEPARFAELQQGGSETIYLTAIDKDGNIVSLIQSNYSAFGSALTPKHAGFVMHNRGGLFTLDAGQPNTLAPRKRPLHTIIPAFMEKGDVKIGFGIMGGWNQSQAHAQFVADIADYGLTIQQALEAGRFTKTTFDGCDVQIESRVPEATLQQLRALGHEVQLRSPRTGFFGWGQAVMSTGTGAHFGASDPRHDGAAIPQSGPLLKP
jgi:gamma-glutamyltranspeptidase/glutathione hydrolase